jgi:hypothetical protein
MLPYSMYFPIALSVGHAFFANDWLTTATFSLS